MMPGRLLTLAVAAGTAFAMRRLYQGSLPARRAVSDAPDGQTPEIDPDDPFAGCDTLTEVNARMQLLQVRLAAAEKAAKTQDDAETVRAYRQVVAAKYKEKLEELHQPAPPGNDGRGNDGSELAA